MDNPELRSLLGIYRADDADAADARFDEARAEAKNDPALAQWWAEEQELDALIGAKLQSAHLPVGLQARILERRAPVLAHRSTWGRKVALLAAAIAVCAVIFSSWRGPFQPQNSLANYRDEMVSFINVAPSLELETNDLQKVNNFLAQTDAPANFAIPEKLRAMEPVGCRTLRFRGHDVALVCFKRGDGKLLHLFVVKRAAFPRLARGGVRDYSAQGDWMTATWADEKQAYLMMVQGDRAALDKYFENS